MPFMGPIFNPATQTPQQLMPIDQAPLDLDDVQGDVLIGLQKKAQRLIVFAINDPQTFKAALRNVILPRVTSCADAHKREGQLRDHKVAAVDASSDEWSALIEMCGLNIAFTQHGLQKLVLGLNPNSLPAAFVRPAADIARQCGDPVDPSGRPSTWDPPSRAMRSTACSTSPDHPARSSIRAGRSCASR